MTQIRIVWALLVRCQQETQGVSRAVISKRDPGEPDSRGRVCRIEVERGLKGAPRCFEPVQIEEPLASSPVGRGVLGRQFLYPGHVAKRDVDLAGCREAPGQVVVPARLRAVQGQRLCVRLASGLKDALGLERHPQLAASVRDLRRAARAFSQGAKQLGNVRVMGCQIRQRRGRNGGRASRRQSGQNGERRHAESRRNGDPARNPAKKRALFHAPTIPVVVRDGQRKA